MWGQSAGLPLPNRIMSRKRVGLALSGGVARGVIHVGVLNVLEKAGIPIDYVAGTSAGSIVGAAYCAGLPVAEILEKASGMGWRQMAQLKWPGHGIVSFERLERWLEELIGDVDIRDLAIPLTVVTTDLQTGETVALHSGRLATAVRASSSVPGVIEPVLINGRLLGDGGVSNNLPVDVVRDMGADYVIAVDLFARDGSGMPGNPVTHGLVALETLIRKSGGHPAEADCLIQPLIGGYDYLNFSKSAEYVAAGEAAATKMLAKIQQDLMEN